MAFTDWAAQVAGNVGGYLRDPTTADEFFNEQMNIDPYRTPQEEWRSLIAGAPPFWETRVPLEDMRKNLEARYLLAGGEMQAQDIEPSFGLFASQIMPSQMGWGTGAPSYSAGYGIDGTMQPENRWALGQKALRERALDAAYAATVDPELYEGRIAQQYGVESPEYKRARWNVETFGAGTDPAQALKNQLAVAQMIGLQRKGGGVWRGRMAQIIRNATQRLMSYSQNIGEPKASFLSYYLGSQQGRTDPAYSYTGIRSPSQLASGTQTGGLSQEEINRLTAQKLMLDQQNINMPYVGTRPPPINVQPVQANIPVSQANLPAEQIRTALASAIQPGTSVPAANVWDAYTQGQGSLGLKEDFINTMMTNNNMSRQQAEAFWLQQRITNPTYSA